MHGGGLIDFGQCPRCPGDTTLQLEGRSRVEKRGLRLE